MFFLKTVHLLSAKILPNAQEYTSFHLAAGTFSVGHSERRPSTARTTEESNHTHRHPTSGSRQAPIRHAEKHSFQIAN
jgi:hypothetical protein